MSEDMFGFTAQPRSPAEAALQSATAEVDGLRVHVNTPPEDLMLELETYRGGLLGAVADLLERLYADVPALADGMFTIPELVTLPRASRDGAFHAWADPSRRRN